MLGCGLCWTAQAERIERVRLPVGLNLSDGKILGLCFIVGFLVRLMPEVLAFQSPVGFDTVYYAAVMKSGIVWPHWSSFFASSWLLFALLVPFRGLGVDAFVLLKIVGPALFGLNVAGVYFFARRMLGWDRRLSFLACGFFALQLASLRISWDLLRNGLGLGLLLFALPLIGKVDSRRGLAGFAVLGLLTVFAHEYAGVTLLVVVGGLLAWRLLKRHVDACWKRLLVGVVPASAVFVSGLLLRLSGVAYTVGSNVVEARDVVRGNAGGVFFLVDYLGVRSSIDFYGSYWSLVGSVLLLFAVLYCSYVLLVLKGWFRNGVLGLWTGLLLVGAFGALLVPVCALEYWHRWMFMLVYPFTFFAVNGLRKVWAGKGWRQVVSRFRISRWEARVMVLVTVGLGVSYLATPVLMSGANVSVSSVTATYTYFSTNPTVPYGDVSDVVRVMQWLDVNMPSASCVALQHAFLSWGQLGLDGSHVIVHFEMDLGKAVETALEHGFARVFFVWWNVDIGWYGLSVPESFVRMHDSGRLSVYEYVGV